MMEGVRGSLTKPPAPDGGMIYSEHNAAWNRFAAEVSGAVGYGPAESAATDTTAGESQGH